MDIEKLIVLVRERNEIYDVKHPKHRNKDVITNAWRNIAQQLGTADQEAKSKWQNLRSNYMREKRKRTEIKSGSAAESSQISWPYFSIMSFLDDSLEYNKTVSSVPDVSFNEKSNQSQLEEVFDCEDNSNIHDPRVCYNDNNKTVNELDKSLSEKNLSAPKNVAAPDNSGIGKKHKHSARSDNTIDNLYLQHLKKISSAASEANDTDLMFFKSLLPSMKKVTS